MDCEIVDRYLNILYVEIHLKKEKLKSVFWAPKPVYGSTKRPEYVTDFNDGCAGQCKSYKAFLNICHHNSYFDIDATWAFFATSHRKSPCDGIGATFKRKILRAGLQRPVNNQILIFWAIKEYWKSPIEGITFLTIDKEDMVAARENLKPRYELDVTILGTRSCHHFVPTSQYTIERKQLSINKTVFLTHSFWTYQHYKMRLLSHLNAMTTLLAALMSSDD